MKPHSLVIIFSTFYLLNNAAADPVTPSTIEPPPSVRFTRTFAPRILYSLPSQFAWFHDLISLPIPGQAQTIQIPHVQSGGSGLPGMGSFVYLDIPHGDGERLLSVSYRALGNGTVSALARVISSPSPNAPGDTGFISLTTDIARSGQTWGTVTMPAFQPVTLTADSVLYLFLQSNGTGYRVGQISAVFEIDVPPFTTLPIPDPS